MPKEHAIFKKYQNGITIKDAIEMYNMMISDPKYKNVTTTSSASKRLKELQILYRVGLRHFPRKKKNK
jgi:hypothetical protein|tara:strand:+ start:821 stop:1024 length:204 start_codon:yes stop_codon:yes gene_type:complete